MQDMAFVTSILFAEFIFLNISTDTGFRECAVVDEPKGMQVDSWTVDWMAKREIDSSIRESTIILTVFYLSEKRHLPIIHSSWGCDQR